MNSLLSLAIRIDPDNPDHHLWNNHGTWWCHVTVHLPDFTKTRFRTSLGTANIEEARHLRNGMLALFGHGAEAHGQAGGERPSERSGCLAANGGSSDRSKN